jgi:endonuclease III
MITQYGKSFDFDRFMHVLDEAVRTYDAPVEQLMRVREGSPYRTLISTILSARTRDEVTAPASERLFRAAPTPEKLSMLDVQEIETLIRPVGFYKDKAPRIKEAARMLVHDFKGLVPETMGELLKFPGVGRKTANLVLSEAFSKQTITVDIHVFRISNRLGIIRTLTPLETERDLEKIIPETQRGRYNPLLVAHGQVICKPVSPMCSKCQVYSFCRRVGVIRNR